MIDELLNKLDAYACVVLGGNMAHRRIFVFGSNLKGIHGAGAAKYAAMNHGARYGQGEGLMGNSYALPTCSSPGVKLPPDEVRAAIQRFADFAAANRDMDFLLTAVGCGFAGYEPWMIRVMLPKLTDNVYVQARLMQELG